MFSSSAANQFVIIQQLAFVPFPFFFSTISLPVVIESTVQLGVFNETRLEKSISACATLDAVFVIRNVHYSKKIAIVDWPAAHPAHRTETGCCDQKRNVK